MSQWENRRTALILACSLADYAATRWGLAQGVISEANPVMVSVMAWPVPGGLGLKLGLTAVGVTILVWGRRRGSRIAGPGLDAIVAAYATLMLYHGAWLLATLYPLWP